MRFTKILIGLVIFVVISCPFSILGQEDLSDWLYKTKVTLNTTSSGANVSADVENFPVAITLDADNFDFTQAQNNGADVRFVKDDGTVLPHEIEAWDAENEEAAVWVLVDEVMGNDDEQYFWMYWGNSDAEDASDGAAVFTADDGYVGVWHLADEPNNDEDNYKDATATEAHGQGYNMTASSIADGVVGKCVDLDETAGGIDNGQYIEIGKEPPFDLPGPLTVYIWINTAQWTREYQSILTKGDTSWRILRAGDWAIIEWTCNVGMSENASLPQNELADGEWHLLVARNTRSSLDVYIDGQQQGATGFSGDVNNIEYPVRIGKCAEAEQRYNQQRQFNGMLDEARVLDVAVSADYAKLSWENQKPGQTLVTVSEEVGIGRGAVKAGTKGGRAAEGVRMKVYKVNGRLAGTAENVSGAVMKGAGESVTARCPGLASGLYVVSFDNNGRLMDKVIVAGKK